MEVVTGSDEAAEFCTVAVPVRKAKRLPARIIGVVSAIHHTIEVKAAIEIGTIETGSPSIDINAPWLKIGPSVSVTAKEA